MNIKVKELFPVIPVFSGLNSDALSSLIERVRVFDYSPGDIIISEVSDHDDWKIVRDNLIKNTGINTIPHIYVDRIEKSGKLILKHEHDGRDLEIAYANKVVDHIDNWQDSAGAIKKFGIFFKDFYDKESEWWYLFEDAFINSENIDSIEYAIGRGWDTHQFNAYHGKTINACLNLDHSWVPKYNTGWHVQADKFGDVLKDNKLQRLK